MAGSVKFILPTNYMQSDNPFTKRLNTRQYLYVFGDTMPASKRRKIRTQNLVRAAVNLKPYFRAAQLAHKWVSGYRARKSAGRLVLRPRNSTANRKKKKYQRVKANVAGTTYTTSRMIVRRTPKEQRFLRKIFRDGASQESKYVQRFGFAFMGAAVNNKAIWYSVTHLKFNNICHYFYRRTIGPNQVVGAPSSVTFQNNSFQGNTPSNSIYIGKCTFNYELYNPTNYNMTVYIYDLICKHDTPLEILYSSGQTVANSSSPEACMMQSSETLKNTAQQNGWYIASPAFLSSYNNAEITNPDWRMVGMKPTDNFYFNAMWKVKGVKKIILPPASCHHHVVIFNPKSKISLGSIFYRNQDKTTDKKNGVGGLTQSTLFGIEGQVATEKDQAVDSEKVGTLPPKIVVKCIRKVNVWNLELKTQTVYQQNALHELTAPHIFTDLNETTPMEV